MSDTQLIKDKIDVVDFISEYVQLKPAGVNHKGLCPFHHEKTPSFMTNRERQNWHCFGCNKGGDVFTFLQEIEGMEFVEALKYLANRAGVPLTVRENEINSNQRNRIKDINTEAARFFHNFLLRMNAAKSAREYLECRGLKPETIVEWQIGFISDQWDLLTNYLLKKGHSIDDLVASGLTIKRDDANQSSGRGFYDRFRGRIMFPIWDIHDAVVGFTGRVLVETEHSGGKYINTPQTLVYDKSQVVFGLNKAKKEIKAKDLIVMVEGQMDVIACHQAGMKNVVATSGTALTEEQIKLIKRYSPRINIAFDADAAGQSAAKRGIDMARAEGMLVRVIKIPEGAGKDPDECLKKNSDMWWKSVEEARDIMEWYTQKAFAEKNLKDPRQLQFAVNEVLAEIALIPFAVEREHWLKELSGRVRIEVAVLRENLVEVKKRQKKIRNNSSERVESWKLETGEKEKPQPSQEVSQPATRLGLLSERLLALILRFPQLSETMVSADIKLNSILSISPYARLYENLKKLYSNGNSVNSDDLRGLSILDNGEDFVDILLMKGELDFFDLTEAEARKECGLLAGQIQNEWMKEKRKQLQVQIVEAEAVGDKVKIVELLEEVNKL